MKQSTILHDVTPEQITSFFEGLQNQLKELKEKFEPKQPEELLTRKEAAALLKCDISTIFNWVRSGRLIAYSISNRVYFKRSEIEKALISLGKKKGRNDE
jgi:excisionase family DNA binding protein